MINILLLSLGSYLLGAVPFSYLIPKVFYGVDISRHGSGNVGATNVVRTVGRGPGIACFLLDVAKGAAPVAVAQTLAGSAVWWPLVAAALAILGHSYSIFLRGKGGKAVATGVGTILALNPYAGLAALGVWLIVFQISRVVSIASITAALVLPGLMSAVPRPDLHRDPALYVYYAMATGLYVIVRHQDNIRRIMAGTEPRFGKSPGSDS